MRCNWIVRRNVGTRAVSGSMKAYGNLNGMQIRQSRHAAIAIGALLAIFAAAGCSPKPEATGPQAADIGGLHIVLAADPSPVRVGDNTLIVTVIDSSTNKPVVDANVTVSTYNQLAGGGDQETGRSQGNGVYNVPIRLAIMDMYKTTVTIQRVGKPDVSAQFTLNAG